MATRKPKPQDTEPDIQLLTTAKCPSISGSSEIRYSIGIDNNKDIWIKIVSSSGGGQINNSWISFDKILKLLERMSGGESFAASIFLPIFSDVSRNNCGFTLAMGLQEKLVITQEGKRRKFIYNSPIAFLAKIEKLIVAKASKPSSGRKSKATT